MSNPTTKAELLARMHAGRAEWDALLGQVPEERLTEPALADGWSLKDLIAHVSAYEQWTADQLRAAGRGEREMVIRPQDPPADEPYDMNANNARIYAANRDRPLAEVLAESPLAFQALVDAIEALPEDLLTGPDRVAWTRGGSLLDIVPEQSYDHYAQHAADVRAFLEREPVSEETG
ncbi:MAG TPA: ClbS/DfsB family four-helix bundle protein [Chloroflexia bacterium]|nr:ClbS/DfsB family four-helix bundle protein [Chloroflexia bacterium]